MKNKLTLLKNILSINGSNEEKIEQLKELIGQYRIRKKRN